MKVLIESQYFPNLAYFNVLSRAGEVIVDVHEHYEKQTFRNRTVINGANGPLNLSIPVQHHHPKMVMNEVQVDFRQKWVNTHWRAIQSAYGKAPFFDYYADYFKDIVYSGADDLLSYNKSILSLCLKLLQLDTKLSYSDNYFETVPNDFEDYRSVIHPKKKQGNMAGFEPKVYTQIFGTDFVPNLSVLDVLFCEGPNALEFVKSAS